MSSPGPRAPRAPAASPGSPARVWHMLYCFPPNDFAEVELGYEQFAERFAPIIDVFDTEGVKFALEVHPTEIAYDFADHAQDARRARSPRGLRRSTSTRSHFAHQFLDSAAFVTEFADRIYHVHVKDSIKRLDGRRSILGSPPELRRGGARLGLRLPRPRRRRLRGAVPHAEPDRLPGPALDRVGGLGMDRDWGAPDALAFVRRTDFAPLRRVRRGLRARIEGRDRRRRRRRRLVARPSTCCCARSRSTSR